MSGRRVAGGRGRTSLEEFVRVACSTDPLDPVIRPRRLALAPRAAMVFRALLLARKCHIPCKGYGARTKWYFTLNALIREYIGYLSISYRFHMLVILFYTIALLMFTLFDYLNKTGAINIKNFLHI